MIIPDVLNGRIAQRPNVFYYHWHNQSSAVELQVAEDQLNCSSIKFYHDNQEQLIVNYISSLMMVHIDIVYIQLYCVKLFIHIIVTIIFISNILLKQSS